MRNIGIIEHISLDGVIQVPGEWSAPRSKSNARILISRGIVQAWLS